MARVIVVALGFVLVLLGGIWRELELLNRQAAAPPCIVSSAAPVAGSSRAALETPAARRARFDRQARELVRWEEEYEYLMQRARTGSRDPEMPPR